MKSFITLTFLLLVSLALNAQTPNPAYDPALAKTLKGNDNGMKKYVLAILKTGSNTTADTLARDTLFAGHMKNINRLADSGKLSVAGPLGKNDKNYRGIFIFNVETTEEGQKLLETDPAIKAKLLEADLFTFWCTAALQEIPRLHNSIVKFK